MLRRSLVIGAVGVSTLLAGSLPTVATADTERRATAPVATTGQGITAYTHTPKDSLRNLGARVGLRIGTAVNPDLLGTNAKYTKVAAEQFSSITAENVMKWEAVEPTRGVYTWEKADQVVAFAREHKQRVRGHTLVWHNQLPKWLSSDGQTTTLSNAEVKAVLKKHVQDQVRHFKGKIWHWDVVNEAFNDDGTPRETIFYKAWGGTGYIAAAFRWAHDADPKAKLYYNDYNLEFTGPKSNAAYRYVKRLVRLGVPIDGVGFQGHLDTQYGYPDLQNNLRRFARLGLQVAITEADVRTFTKADEGKPNEPMSALAQTAQEHYWSRMLQDCLAVRQCVSFTLWGFGDAYSWVPGWFKGEGAALVYDENLDPKPQYFILQQDLKLAGGAPHRGGRRDRR